MKPSAVKSFKPLIHPDCRVLILGTMPGEESLRQKQYYAHAQNLFWPLIFRVFEASAETDYSRKKQFLLDRNIALWDVFESCEREGSLDSNIHCESRNDIAGLLEAFPRIQYVFCNGKTAADQFNRFVMPLLKRPVYAMCLPSTSPANASVRYDEKLRQWMQIRHVLEDRVRFEAIARTSAGPFTILCDEREVLHILLPGAERPLLVSYAVFSANELCKRAARQIEEYMAGKRRAFSLPFTVPGTAFGQGVYRELLKVPYGQTIGYGALAEKAGRPKAARAVGGLMRINPLPLLIPCHRVIGSNGKNIGFMGIRGNPMQRTLLNLENKNQAGIIEPYENI